MEFPPSSWSMRELGLFETAVAKATEGLSMQVLAKVNTPNPNHIHPLLNQSLIVYYPQIRQSGMVMDDFRVVLSGNSTIDVSQVEISRQKKSNP